MSTVKTGNATSAVIFDLDGLMADSEALAIWAWDQFLGRYGHRLDDEVLPAILGLRVVDSARYLCQHWELPVDPQQAAAERDRLFMAAVPTQLRACPGLYPLLDELAARGLPLAVGSSGRRDYVNLALWTLGIDDRFAAIATGDDVAHGKPAPDVFVLAAKRLNTPPARCLVLEDARLGAQAALAAGMSCVVVPNHWARVGDLPLRAVLPSLHQVRELLDELL